MNTKITAALGALALLAGAALAVEFANSSTTQPNAIAARLDGSWAIDTEITRRLDPDPSMTAPRTLRFVRDDNVQRKLADNYPRFAAGEIYMSGIAVMHDLKHWFIVMNVNGNAYLVLFTPDRVEPTKEPHQVFINMVVSRDTGKDLLFLGGSFARESAVAYHRTR